MRHKDGVDELYPVVHAESWQEAMQLASRGVVFKCPDGITITFGTQTIRGMWVKPARS